MTFPLECANLCKKCIDVLIIRTLVQLIEFFSTLSRSHCLCIFNIPRTLILFSPPNLTFSISLFISLYNNSISLLIDSILSPPPLPPSFLSFSPLIQYSFDIYFPASLSRTHYLQFFFSFSLFTSSLFSSNDFCCFNIIFGLSTNSC